MAEQGMMISADSHVIEPRKLREIKRKVVCENVTRLYNIDLNEAG